MKFNEIFELFNGIFCKFYSLILIIFNNDIFKSFSGLFIGWFLTSRISKEQVSDNNKFLVLTQAKNEIMISVDKSHNNVNDYISILNKIGSVIFSSIKQKNESESKFIILDLLTDLSHVINSTRISNNSIISNIELLKSIYGYNENYIIKFENDFLTNSLKCIKYLELKNSEVVEFLDKRNKKEISLKVLNDEIGLIMIEISKNEVITKFMDSHAANIIELINLKITKIIKK